VYDGSLPNFQIRVSLFQFHLLRRHSVPNTSSIAFRTKIGFSRLEPHESIRRALPVNFRRNVAGTTERFVMCPPSPKHYSSNDAASTIDIFQTSSRRHEIERNRVHHHTLCDDTVTRVIRKRRLESSRITTRRYCCVLRRFHTDVAVPGGHCATRSKYSFRENRRVVRNETDTVRYRQSRTCNVILRTYMCANARFAVLLFFFSPRGIFLSLSFFFSFNISLYVSKKL